MRLFCVSLACGVVLLSFLVLDGCSAPRDHGDGNGDVDGDGDGDGDADIPCERMIDTDGDTISDFHEGSGDFDNDGEVNYLDEDSDGDGDGNIGSHSGTTVPGLPNDDVPFFLHSVVRDPETELPEIQQAVEHLDQAIEELNAIGARVIGVGSSAWGNAINHMSYVATATGTVDPTGQPLVYDSGAWHHRRV